ncbi:2-phospho-L-lactate guanylyltransferase [Marinactinospora thermotolerans]|uniref:Phosphoenolpyruvate guanylyltransferase n=1 Tax=Marinactinospora thermotolerans DSM 45154 TaxID=1122192 RepID=A0A1T4SFC5_9ACTN|nr:2-phospho-L-lactate guanylyltransferase [Marinactinospora thermotolerans]SKA26892.1 2-phospho-L-lactate guanylyltransferase [Marinactinospora thermotolerans DSM 45154]
MTTDQAGGEWTLVVPVKRLSAGKSRLAGFAGEHRGELALAVACDTVQAAVSCPSVVAVFVVTDDPLVARRVTDLGARVVPDPPEAGLNPALVHGAAHATALFPRAGTCALSADLPALRPGELERVLGAAVAHERSFLPDTPGVGTTLYATAPGAVFAPGFEGESRRRHRELGAVELAVEEVASVRRDVDTPADLAEAVALGVGPHTAKVLARLGL